MISKLSLLVVLVFLTILKFKIPEFSFAIFVFITAFVLMIYFGYKLVFDLLGKMFKK